MAAVGRGLGLRLHSHLSETADYVRHAREHFDTKPVLWCAEQGWIGPDVSFAHMVHLDEEEIALCGQTGTGNRALSAEQRAAGQWRGTGSGAGAGRGIDQHRRGRRRLQRGRRHDHRTAQRLLIHRSVKGAQAQSADHLVHWACEGGARVLGLDEVGTIEPGRQADLALIDLSHPRYFGNHDPALHRSRPAAR
jgi:cytosine/adenosine deaminase-related metal-dependent hydrolase